MWANGASVTESYRNVAVGSEIPESDILAYFVWIPRYEYMYTNLGDQYSGGTKEDPGEITINFISKDITTPSSDNYKVHPAFTFGEEELSGMWVGKFETTGDATTPTIKPNLSSLRDQKVSTQFATAQLFSSNASTYGISLSADSHMMKNSEWGAVAYLSQSKYGKQGNPSYSGANKRIYINNYWNSGSLTGCSAGVPSTSQDSSCAYTYEKNLGGTGASTTGTIYGIYDMSGGVEEYVMGTYRGMNASPVWGASLDANYAGFQGAPLSKYYDEYLIENITTACNGGICYGHALSETEGWYSLPSNYVVRNCPWFHRGGLFLGQKITGIFYASISTGGSGIYSTFRVVLVGL